MIGTSQLNPYMVGKWQVEANTCSLFYEPARHRFRFENAHTGQAKTFRATLYDDQYAISLISLFQHTIAINLAQETFKTVQSACFFPKLCVPIEQDPNIQVALFGYENSAEELKGLRWGVHYNITDEEQTLEVGEEERVARAFVRYAASTNEPDLQPKTDEQDQPILKNGKPVLKPIPNHYAMHAYTQHFRLSLIQNVDQRIQRIALQYMSLLDSTITLDENKWAITLVSSLSASQSFFSRLFNGNVGHAMLACEGIKEGKPFLKYVHFTQIPANKHPNLKADEGQIECFERLKPLKTHNGPTWLRPKNLVQHMLDYVQQQEYKPRKFAFYGNFFSKPNIVWLAFQTEILGTKSLSEVYEEILNASPQTCLSCAYELAILCGIIFQPEESFRKPLEKIRMLKTAPIFLIPEGLDRTHLGTPFILENSELKEISHKILSACVVLTPEDSLPEDGVKWSKQAMIEETAATNLQIARLEACETIGELWQVFQYKPKHW